MNHLDYEATPAYKISNISKKWGKNVYIKRDDRFLSGYGGSKARILRYILWAIIEQKIDLIITAGGPCSNFLRAISVECAEHGIELWIVSYTDRAEEYKSLNFYITELMGAQITRCSKDSVKDTIEALKNKATVDNRRWKYVYGGAEGSIEGVLAYYDAIKELKKQLSDDECARLREIWLPVGTGTTISGISFGCEDLMPNVTIHGVSVARKKDLVMQKISSNSELFTEVKNKKYSFNNVIIHEMGGYSRHNIEVSDVIAEFALNEGIILDEVYSGKAAYYLKNEGLSEDGSIVLLWLTGGLLNGISRINEL